MWLSWINRLQHCSGSKTGEHQQVGGCSPAPHQSCRTARKSLLQPFKAPHSQVCPPSGQRGLSDVPLGTVDRHTVVLVPAAVRISGHEAAMAAPAVDLTHVQGYLAHFPLGTHIELPLEREQDWVRSEPLLSSQPLKKGSCHLGDPREGMQTANKVAVSSGSCLGGPKGAEQGGRAHPVSIQ